jgi:aspartate racemase
VRTIGLIGGMSWHSTEIYYRVINRTVNQKLGGSHSAKILLHSVDYNEIKELQHVNDWKSIGEMLSKIAMGLETNGADCIAMCCNTTHLVADQVREKIKIPLVHIADATADIIEQRNIKKVGLLGTRFTLENPFFTDRLVMKNIQTIIPCNEDKEFVHDSILSELARGIYTAQTKTKYLEIIERLHKQGAEGIVFACTEIGSLIAADDCLLPVFDTTIIHANAIVDKVL